MWTIRNWARYDRDHPILLPQLIESKRHRCHRSLISSGATLSMICQNVRTICVAIAEHSLRCGAKITMAGRFQSM